MVEPTDRWDDGGGQDNDRSIESLLGIGQPPNHPKESYRAGDIADEFGLTAESLRFYENCGILRPARQGSVVDYSRKDRSRLRIALAARALGFSLPEAKELAAHYAGGTD